VLRQLVDVWFQVLFHSPSGVLFAFPSRYWFTIGRQRVFSLGGWSPQVPAGLHVSDGTQVPIGRNQVLIYRTITFYGMTFQSISTNLIFFPGSKPDGSYNPDPRAMPMVLQLIDTARKSVWTIARSLATTKAISFDFSSFGY
jgi:hypothetical protein